MNDQESYAGKEYYPVHRVFQNFQVQVISLSRAQFEAGHREFYLIERIILISIFLIRHLRVVNDKSLIRELSSSIYFFTLLNELLFSVSAAFNTAIILSVSFSSCLP